jgi:hypothetical protein
MQRQIFEVYAKVVDANGAYNTLSGYPKVFDSKNYDNDIAKTLQRARGSYYETIGAMCKRDDRQLQTAILMYADGQVIEQSAIGEIAEIEENGGE